ncbi:MAG: short-chain dehydrogenase/reductase [Rhodospirillales bacterium]|nr:short-chain dehydrogenase/reductase [Rhodospirillales bacterium]
MTASTAPVWLITGCSTGIGREIAIAALEKKYRVVLTARDPGTVEDLRAQYPGQAIAVALDVTKPEQIASVIAEGNTAFGQIDVMVNNAGYGYLAAIEEGDEDEVRAMFETNFWGPMKLIRAILPEMRKRRSGYIINISSQAGLMSNPGTAFYSASKFAMEGMTEGLSREVKPFGIRVTAVEPGPFRTDWSGRSMKQVADPIPDYAEHVGSRRAFIASMHGKLPGDPKRAGQAIVALYDIAEPPLQLLLGKVLYDSYRTKLDGVIASLKEWEAVTLATDFPSGQ